MTLNILNLKYDAIDVQTSSEEFKKVRTSYYVFFILFFILEFPFPQINPQNTVPFLIDRDTTLNESRTICTYLITNYAKGKLKNLYPKDNLGQRTKIDQKLNYDKFYEALKDDYVGKNQCCQFCLFQFYFKMAKFGDTDDEKSKVFELC